MRMRIPVLITASLLIAPSMVPACGQPSRNEAATPRELKGPELPTYFVVQGFFDQVIAKRRDIGSEAYYRFLQELNIELGGEAHKRLDQALDDAEAILAKPTVDPTLDNEEDYWNYQMEALRERARSLGKLYGNLVLHFDQIGKAAELTQYIDDKIRPDTSIWVAGELPADILSIADEFDREMTRVEDRRPQ